MANTKTRSTNRVPVITNRWWRGALVTLALLAVAWFGAGCCGPAPERRHLQLEWHLRHRMPQWSAREWNAWEAELAAALNQPEPDPPMFPDAAADDGGETDE